MPNFTGGPEDNTWSLTYADIEVVDFDTDPVNHRGDADGGIDTLVLDLSAAPDSILSGVEDDSAPGGFGPGTRFYRVGFFGETVWHRNFERFSIIGSASDDEFSGGASDDVLNGNAGADTLDVGGSGNDNVDGGSDRDRLIIDYSAAISGIFSTPIGAGTIDGSQGGFSDGGSRTVNFNNIDDLTILTGSGNDTVTTGNGDDIVRVSGGTDAVNGGLGLDRLEVFYGAAGAITGGVTGAGTLDSHQGSLTDGAGRIVIFDNVAAFSVVTGTGTFNDSVTTGAGNDTFTISNGVDVVNAGAGSDALTLDYAAATSGVTGGHGAAGTIDELQGSFSDGGSRSVVFDNIMNLAVTTGSGNDTITVKDGINTIDTGAGSDRLVVDYSAKTEGINGNSSMTPGPLGFEGEFGIFLGAFEVSFNNVEHFTVTTGSGSDSLRLSRTDGNDVISAGAGFLDMVELSGGTDSVDGGPGTDYLTLHYGDATSAITSTPISAGSIDGFKGGYSDGAGHVVTFDNIDRIIIHTGSGNDTITTPDYDQNVVLADIIHVNGGSDVVDGGLGDDSLLIDYSHSTADVVGSVTGPGSRDNYQGSFSAGPGFSVAFDNVWSVFVTTGGGNDNISLGPKDDGATVSFGNDVVDGGDSTPFEGDRLFVNYSAATNPVTGTTTTAGTLHGSKGSFTDGGSRTVNFDNIDRVEISTGSGDDHFVSGASRDEIFAGAGNDFMDSGNDGTPDRMLGGDGDDTYIVTNSSDWVEEGHGRALGSGFDTVFASVSYSLEADGAGVEKLVLTGGSNINGTGDQFGNILIGNSGANSLTGVEGDDLFVAMPGMGADRVTDFVAGVDTDDRVDVSAFPSLLTLEDVLALATQQGAHTVIDFGNGDTLTLENVLRSNLVAEDFGFVGNDAPSGGDSFVVTNEDTPYVFVAADFRFSDLGDAQPNAFAGVRISSLPTAGMLTNNGVAVAAGDFVSAAAINGALLRFTPAPDGNGLEYASFTFQVQDDGGTANGGVDLDPTPNEMIIDVTPVDDAPVAQDGSAGGNEDTPINGTLAAADVDSASLSFSLVTNAAHGSVTVNADGTFSYTPNANFNGADSFTFKANDGSDDSNIATVSLTVDPVNDAPVAQDGSASGNEDTPINGTLAAADVDSASLSFSLVTNAAHGSVTVNADRTFSYTPNANFNGADSFTFKANDGSDDSNIATVSLTVNSVDDPDNDPPAIVSNGGGDAGNVSTPENTTAVTTVVATDPDSPLLSYSIVGGSDADKFHINGSTGALSFITAPDFEAPADSNHDNGYVAQVRASDGSLSDDQLITVRVLDTDESTHTVRWIKSVDAGAHPRGTGLTMLPFYSWLPSGIGDFNGDGTSDLAWHSPTLGSIDIWKLADGKWAGSVDAGWHPLGYSPTGFADFNRDGTTDILWFNPASHHVDVWKIVDGHWAGSADIGTHPEGWAPVLTGDFNGDGTSDLVWHNPTTNGIDIWKINSGQWAGSVDVGTHPVGYRPALAGDFNGDGTSDIAWHNAATGDVDIWKMSNGQWAGSVSVGSHPAGWQPLGAGDFNKDGTSDIAWYNPATNQIDVWLMHDGHWAGSVDVGTHPAGWVAVGIGDFDRNGVNDVMWFNPVTGQIDNWMLA